MNIFSNTMADMNWPAIKCSTEENAVVLLPLGVIEQHGPHLCTATDIYTAHIYCNAVKQKLESAGYAVIIAPPFYWGVCQSAKGFPGTFNIRAETAQALLYDMLASLKDFGFERVFGINTHGDVEHKIAAMNAFKDASERLEIAACFPYEEFFTQHMGLSSGEPYFYEIKPQQITVSCAAVSDVHAGDIETATIYTYYPQLVDVETAKSLPDVPLGDNWGAWMFGGQLKNISPNGYLGSPASFESVDISRNVDDNARRITDGILAKINNLTH